MVERYYPKRHCCLCLAGISQDYSFDVAVANEFGCRGIAADPTVVHNSTIHPKVTFHNIAANSPGSQRQQDWWVTTIPGLRRWLKTEHLAVLKIDCEGCEYSLATDVLLEDPEFFHRIDQVAMEVHWSRTWLASKDHMYAMASLFDLLEEAGLQLMSASLTSCGPFTTNAGLLPELQEYMTSLFVDGPKLYCHNYLFARP